MNTVAIHVGIVRVTRSNEIYPHYASSKQDLLDKVKDWLEDWFSTQLEEFDRGNALRFIEEGDDCTEHLISLYKEHLDTHENIDSFEFSTEQLNIVLNNKFDVIEIEEA